MLLGARHVPERLCGILLGALYQVLDLCLYLLPLTKLS